MSQIWENFSARSDYINKTLQGLNEVTCRGSFQPKLFWMEDIASPGSLAWASRDDCSPLRPRRGVDDPGGSASPREVGCAQRLGQESSPRPQGRGGYEATHGSGEQQGEGVEGK